MKSAEEKAREDMQRSQDIACAHDICVALKEMEEEYDERTCITAGELRAMGAHVPDSIPDCGWVPKHCVRFGEPKISLDEVDPMMLHVDTPVTFSEPFRWVSVDLVLGNTSKDCRP